MMPYSHVATLTRIHNVAWIWINLGTERWLLRKNLLSCQQTFEIRISMSRLSFLLQHNAILYLRYLGKLPAENPEPIVKFYKNL